MKEYLNFMGDTQDYKFHRPLPNPFGLRGNPDTQANSPDQGDGLNGTPEFENFTGEEVSNRWFNQTSDGAEQSGPNWFQRTFGSGEGDASSWWSRTFGQDREGYTPLSPEQKRQRAANWSQGISKGIQAFNIGQGAFTTTPTQGLTSPQFQPMQPPGSTTTTNVTEAGMGGGSKTIGYVLIGVAILGLAVFAISASRPKSQAEMDIKNL